jgi:hypothetical protein
LSIIAQVSMRSRKKPLQSNELERRMNAREQKDLSSI